ncbi:MAG TPA: non-heme iron oxygenase ferredoxin subunit [Herbaspirillum sp.]|nr:non-heme iron oxygenase ferredoxin subunit [Herbaspirillum sp.]
MHQKCHRICPVKDLAVNSIQKFDIDGNSVAIYNIDGAVYATDDTCTHGLASLSKGELDGDIVECSLHFGAFHVPTGKPVGAPCSIALRTYRTEVIEAVVHIYSD